MTHEIPKKIRYDSSMENVTINIAKEDIGFAAGHFTIFSKTERERLHGHNYRVSIQINTTLNDDGLSFDYNVFKTKLRSLCQSLDEYVLLPSESPHLTLEENDDYTYALFNGERIPFLASDVLILPIRNTTVEELSRHLLDKVLEDKAISALNAVQSIALTIEAGHGQSGTSTWAG